jgi:hypothetical protein
MSPASSTVGSPPPHGVFTPRHRLRVIVSTIAVILCSSCSGGTTDPPEDTAEREAFIGAYMDLRTESLGYPSTDLDNEVRDSILSVYGVTDQDLLDFIDMHGEDVEYMRDLWTEVETRQTERLEQNAQGEEDEATDGSDRTEDGDAGL